LPLKRPAAKQPVIHRLQFLVTGANRGIGLALARTFHQHGFSVIATARKPNEALELKTIGVETLQLDITDPASIAALKSDLSRSPNRYSAQQRGNQRA